jgi:hypothetical protein
MLYAFVLPFPYTRPKEIVNSAGIDLINQDALKGVSRASHTRRGASSTTRQKSVSGEAGDTLVNPIKELGIDLE